VTNNNSSFFIQQFKKNSFMIKQLLFIVALSLVISQANAQVSISSTETLSINNGVFYCNENLTNSGTLSISSGGTGSMVIAAAKISITT
jgi:hypothetical protein